MAYIKKIKLPNVAESYDIYDSSAVHSVNGKTGTAVTLSAGDVGALPTSGGTLTGNLTVGSAKMQTNGCVVGTWLQGTSANHLTTAATKFAVQDDSGWVYHRTASEALSDMGGASVSVGTASNDANLWFDTN